MKCPKCNGTGEITEKRHQYTVTYRCELCEGTGEYNHTNEDWLHSLNTEQLAELLTRISDNEWEYHVMPSRMQEWLEWLKQPHKE